MEEQEKNKIWKKCLENMQVSVSKAYYSTWLINTFLKELKENNDRYTATVACESSFIKATIETRYFGLIQDTLSSVLNQQVDVLFTVDQNPDKNTSEETNTNTPLFTEKQNSSELFDLAAKAGIRPTLTFDNYAVSSTNQMAWAAAEAVTKNPGTTYNPLFIWGGVGVGKTHLMNAIGYNLIKNTSKTALFCTGETFTNDIVEGIRTKSTQAFRQRYRKLDVLMLDDVQFIAGKDAVQEEFFHTFNTLVAAGKQIILTSDRPPTEISKLEDRLRSRFEAGLIVDIAPPDFELRCAVAQIKARDRGMDLQTEWIHLIAGNIHTPREIEGFLIKLHSQTTLNKEPITEELINSLLNRNGIETKKHIKANPTQVISIVSKYCSVHKKDLLGNSRKQNIARPRQLLMYILRKDLDMPYQEIGRLIGGRDHTTVMHAVDKITRLASTNVEIREDIAGIKQHL